LGLLEGDGDGPKVVAAVNIPLDEVAVALWEEGLEAIRLADGGSLVVAALLVLLVVAVVGVELQARRLVRPFHGGTFRPQQIGKPTRFPNLPIWCLRKASR
jgi:hypothetical protein